MKAKFIESLKEYIEKSSISENDKADLLKRLFLLDEKKVNLLITGATGCGKSSTINALFETEVAKVGCGANPETMEIEKYNLKNLILWDSPGLGDGIEADNRHAKNIINKLTEKDSEGNLLIDLVLVILDGSSRDLGTSYELINRVVLPNIGNDPKRILVAINQADMAMKGRSWNHEKNCPEPELEKFLKEKVESVKKRIKDGTGVDVEPIYYSAGYKDGDNVQEAPYNLTKLLYYIVQNTSKEKRSAYIDNIRRDENVWKHDDGEKNYRAETAETLIDSVVSGAKAGAAIGSVIPGVGTAAGAAVGAVVGFAKKRFGGFFGW